MELKKINIETLTLGEIKFIEKTAKCPLSKLGDTDAMTSPMLIAIATVAARRSGRPDATIEEIENEVTFQQAVDLIDHAE